MNTPLRVLIVEDSEDDTLMLLRQLQRGGYDVTHKRVDTAEAMAAALDKQTWDIILSDHRMPQFSSLAALKLWQEKGLDLPFIIVSGTIGEDAAVEAMKAGAQDYIMKNNLKRLVPAIKRELQEAEVRRQRRLAEELNRIILHTTIEGFALVDAHDGHFLDVNDAYCHLLGYSRAEMLTMSIQDVRATAPEQVAQQMQQLKKAGSAHFETRQQCKDGHIVDIEISISYMDIEGGRLFGFVRDISERKRAEEALRVAEENFRHSLDESPLGIRIVNAEGELLYANQAILDIYGYSSVDELKNRLSKERYTPESYIEHRKRIGDRKLGKPVPPNYEISIVRKDGEVRHLAVFRKEVTWDGKIQFQILYQDITERKQAEEALKRSEQKYRELAESISDIFFAMNGELRYTYWNKASEKLTGVSTKDALGKHLYDLFPDVEATRMAEEIYLKAIRTKQPQQFFNEYQLGGKDFVFEVSAYPSQDGVSVFVKDITERKRAEKALKESEQNYRELAESISDVFFAMDEELRVTYWNKASERLTGIAAKDALGKHTSDLFPEDEATRIGVEAAQRLEITGQFQQYITRYQFGGKDFIFEISLYPSHDGRSILAKDITERMKTEKALRESEQKYRTLIENVPLKIFYKDKNSVYISCNYNYARDLKIESDEITGKTDDEFYPRELAGKYRADDRRVIESGKPERLEEQYVAGGEKMFVETFKTLVKDEKGEVIGVLGVFHDITVRKQAEEQLRESAERLHLTFEAVNDGIAVVDLTGVVTQVNRRLVEMVGLSSAEEALGKTAFEFVAPRDHEKLEMSIGQIIEQGTIKGTELTMVRKDGSETPIEASGGLLRDASGNPISVVTAIRDITERKRAEEQLRESAERLHLIFEAASDGIAVTDLSGVFTQVNRKMVEMCGVSSEEEILGKTAFEFTAPRDHEKLEMSIRRTVEQGILMNVEYTMIRENGSEIPVEGSGGLLRDASGNPMSMVAIMRDITERKQAEEALRASEEKYRLVVENAHEAILVVQDEIVKFSNPKALSLAQRLGYSPEDVVSKPFIEFIHSADRKTVMERYLMSIEGKPPPTTYPIRVTDKGGNMRWLDVSAVLITWEGRPAMLHFLNDISERKQAEEALQASEEKYRLVVENAHEAILLVQDDFVKLSNPKALSLAQSLGCPPEEFTSKTLMEFTHPADREMLMEHYLMFIEGKLPLTDYPVRVIDKGGNVRWLEVSAVSINWEGRPAILDFTSDITERKQAEEALKQSLDNLQRTIEGTIQAVALIAETRDPYTAGHQRRVAKLASAIAEEMGLSKDQIETILVAGTLHDVGKVCVPAEILSKPGRLTNTEMELIKAHSQVGCDILKTIQFPWPICPLVLQHHERMDGSGYPSGISGEDITLEARILAVADVVEATSSHRPYRPALGIDKALEEISRNRSRLYDPKVVDACLRLFTEKGFKFEE